MAIASDPETNSCSVLFRSPPPTTQRSGEAWRGDTRRRRLALSCRGGNFSAVGAAFLAAPGGDGGRGFYFEVEVLEKGKVFVGLAGTNLGLQCTKLGDDACSWGGENDGYAQHRWPIDAAIEARLGFARAAERQGEKARFGSNPAGSAPGPKWAQERKYLATA